MTTEKQLEDIELYIQNLHDRLKIVENWIMKKESKKVALSDVEQKIITEKIKEAEELGT